MRHKRIPTDVEPVLRLPPSECLCETTDVADGRPHCENSAAVVAEANYNGTSTRNGAYDDCAMVCWLGGIVARAIVWKRCNAEVDIILHPVCVPIPLPRHLFDRFTC